MSLFVIYTLDHTLESSGIWLDSSPKRMSSLSCFPRASGYLTVPSKVKAINPAVKKLMRMLKPACLAPSQAFAIETALREALANANVYGNRADPTKKVRDCCGCDNHGIRIVIADEGDGFDPETLANPLVGKNLDADHGRGIFLINTLMDEVRFENGGRTIRMRKKRPPSP